MGWLFGWNTRKEYVVRSYERPGGPYIVANLDVGQEFRLKKSRIKDVEGMTP